MDHETLTFMARETALRRAQREAETGLIKEDRIIEKACQYEAYLSGKPVPIISALSEEPSQSSEDRVIDLPSALQSKASGQQ